MNIVAIVYRRVHRNKVFCVEPLNQQAAAVAQCVRGWPCKRKSGCSNPSLDRLKSLKKDSDISTDKCSGTGVSVKDPQRLPLHKDAPCHSRCGTLKNVTAQ